MDSPVLQLYPLPAQELPLQGLYLSHDLRRQRASTSGAFVYSNFVASVDGRIAVPGPSGSGLIVPEQVANPRDWRLFQELAVQADILITSGRYLRDYGQGRAQEILRVYDDPAFADLRGWRVERGLPPLPDLAVVSRSLRFPIPPALTREGRSVVVVTTRDADPGRIRRLEEQLGRVVVAGGTSVEGGPLIDALRDLGYRMVYSATGPKVLHLLLRARALDRLYLTLVSRALGGSLYSSIVEGEPLMPPADFRLSALYYDAHAPDGADQLFASYDSLAGS